VLGKPFSPRWVWDVDISDCFGQISHEFIINKLSKVLYPKGTKLVNKWIKASIIECGVITLPSKGISQGGVISPLLCNMVLNGLESVTRKGYLKEKRNTSKLKLRNI
jgi:RNA-directed DNA polymerase